MNKLVQISREVILNNQSVSGAYIACPNFPSYQYSWLRDGSFIAYSMDLSGEHQSARSYFRWVDNVIHKYTQKIDLILEKVEQGMIPDENDLLHARYTLMGEESIDEWTNIQFDGYGTWLWAFSEHIEFTKDLSLLKDFAFSIEKTVQYLAAVWRYPNYDCWEENPVQIHPYTLAAIYSGVKSAFRMAEITNAIDLSTIPNDLVHTIREFTLEHGVENGRLIKNFFPPGMDRKDKFDNDNGVDASLLGVGIPYQMLDPDDPIMHATVDQIESKLHRKQGGVYRFLADTYYGGGEWLLLAAWLGWYYVEIGDYDLANELRQWIEVQSGDDGHMPEQVSSNTLSPSHVQEWEERWGPVANPLLWSHAMYLILHDALEKKSRSE